MFLMASRMMNSFQRVFNLLYLGQTHVYGNYNFMKCISEKEQKVEMTP